MQTQQPPLIKPAPQPASDPAHGAAIIFLHGLDDDAMGWENIATQFHDGNKLPYMQWVFPNAPHNMDARQNAWYTPSSLNPPPAGRPELAPDEDEEGLIKSVKYVESLLDDLTSRGIPPNRIVLGGFSQGCALALLTELTSSYAGKLAGIVGLMGYLPLPETIQKLRTEAGLPHVVGHVPMFLGRGESDRLVPRSKWTEGLNKLKELGVNDGAMEIKEYEGLAHALSPAVLQDLSKWLERVVPKLED
ncbi:alpha/beta-hydrolase [Aureobasidium pullulans]|uniref:Acyl-protein thioesterase 1 n=1 Tax=Aureobasidium pullulans TaxID=5580 RepID=A0A4S8V6G5_AURPU|nr:alpha/beta-hydrolase [Aureobasidium pullulans]THW65924.1 alpha/beta-hydrolase [Aureobasidium pullulans]THY72380.1 alpha/beta-hydrolase [Aureobasidium pullulans]THZ46883.1 alpha/beta-hydrolase [Aureobasidium pullulans]THZ62889.1 alpha/beta-hydrolase [Aureobasidium pullulans]